jgi:2-polyprenyl-3-methyl-5-hydroxy-6-metoxy-1,4-benzoquinol methylase
MPDDTSFTDQEAAASWNEGAEAYDVFVESGADYYRLEVHGPALVAACGSLQGCRVLDLGCGQGFFSRELARGGARVIGIDLADEFVAAARAHEAREPLGIEFRTLSAPRAADHFPAESFDVVTACMSVQDMSDVRGALDAAFVVLRPGGRLVFSVPHPASDTPYREWERDSAGRKLYLKIDRYFETGPLVCEWNMPRLAYHWSTPYWRYTLSDWVAFITGAGFTLTGLGEPRPTAEQVAANPRLEDCSRMPYFLVFEARKPD